MKPSVNNLNSDQPKKQSKRADKKRVNIPWNHGLFFQVGLIVSLLAVFFIMENAKMYVSAKVVPKERATVEEPYVMSDVILEVETPVKEPVKAEPIVKRVQPVAPIVNAVTPIDDRSTIIETPVPTVDAPVTEAPPVTAIPKPPVDITPKNINSVEFVPVFPGCEALATNGEKVACMSSKIASFIQKKFRTDSFSHLDSDEIQRISVQFQIDKNGYITNVKARAPRADLEKEGARVISQLPKMKPGRQGDANVDVLYMVPIVFKVN